MGGSKSEKMAVAEYRKEPGGELPALCRRKSESRYWGEWGKGKMGKKIK